MLLPGQTDPSIRIGTVLPRGCTPHFELYLGLGASQGRHTRDPDDSGFSSRGDGTDLVLTHERFHDESDRNSHAKGWEGCLIRLSRKFGGR